MVDNMYYAECLPMKRNIFEYIVIWHNYRRRFFHLGFLTIDEFWKQYLYTKQLLK